MDQYVEFVSNHPILFAALAAIVVTLVWTEIRRLTSGVAILSPSNAVLLMNHEDTLVLDVREDGEVAQGKIEGAKHIPLGMLVKRMEELAPHKDKAVIAYCRSGNRSAHACSMLRKAGFQRVHNLRGGIMAWQAANLPVKKR